MGKTLVDTSIPPGTFQTSYTNYVYPPYGQKGNTRRKDVPIPPVLQDESEENTSGDIEMTYRFSSSNKSDTNSNEFVVISPNKNENSVHKISATYSPSTSPSLNTSTPQLQRKNHSPTKSDTPSNNSSTVKDSDTTPSNTNNRKKFTSSPITFSPFSEEDIQFVGVSQVKKSDDLKQNSPQLKSYSPSTVILDYDPLLNDDSPLSLKNQQNDSSNGSGDNPSDPSQQNHPENQNDSSSSQQDTQEVQKNQENENESTPVSTNQPNDPSLSENESQQVEEKNEDHSDTQNENTDQYVQRNGNENQQESTENTPNEQSSISSSTENLNEENQIEEEERKEKEEEEREEEEILKELEQENLLNGNEGIQTNPFRIFLFRYLKGKDEYVVLACSLLYSIIKNPVIDRNLLEKSGLLPFRMVRAQNLLVKNFFFIFFYFYFYFYIIFFSFLFLYYFFIFIFIFFFQKLKLYKNIKK